MPSGAITGYIDVAQLALYGFWLFFAGLIFYLRREDKREGYPLESDDRASNAVRVQGFPFIPTPKTFNMRHGHASIQAPSFLHDSRELRAKPMAKWAGAPLQPTGNPMLDGLGPASYANRFDEPELTVDGDPLLQPMRITHDAYIEPRDPDPRGMEVLGADGKVAGKVVDAWIDRSEPQIRFLELDVAGGGRVLLPMTMARVDGRARKIKVSAILAHQFKDVPRLKNPDVVTKREEDRIVGYYGGGKLYATPQRLGPVL